MDGKLLLSSFALVFLAELGDKTQLATLALASSGSSRWAVFMGASLALIATTAIAVLVGDGLTRVIPAVWLQRGAGVLCLVVGVGLLIGEKAEPAADDAAAGETLPSPPEPTDGEG